MDPLSPSEGSPANTPLPEAGRDADDPLRPEVEQENAPTPPMNAPQQDQDLAEDHGDVSDDESILSEIDEAQFEDFDPAAIAIEERPVAVDGDNVNLIGVHKRKRAEGEEGARKKKNKEGRREKTRKSKHHIDDDDNFSGGEELEGKRIRKKKDIVDSRKERPRPRARTPENEELLTPEERRKRALDRAMDAALKNPNKRRARQAGIDLEAQNDELIENTRRRMTDAAQADTNARERGLPATQKLKMLPEVVALLNRNTLRDQLVDPDINLLEAVRFFLEPLNDGSLPAYNIQRELFAALAKLPINKDALVASGIGKVTLFYTKSTKPEERIKRQAERLLGEWTRPILKRSDDYRKRQLQQAHYDPSSASAARETTGVVTAARDPAASQAAALAAARERKLATPVLTNRARVEGGLGSYTIVPNSNNALVNSGSGRPGGGAEEAFRKMKARQSGKYSGSGR